MAKILLTSKTVDRSKVKKANERVEDNSIELDKLVDEISAPYIGEVDKVMESARKKALAGEFSDYDLDILSLQIPVLLYWASEGQEQSGIRNDISKAIAKQKFNEHYESRATGTIADKTAASELNSMDEQLSQIVYNRTYRMISAKVEAATEFEM